MPTPLDLLADPVSISIFAMYGALLAAERVAPARAVPRGTRWPVRGGLSLLAFFFASAYLPILLGELLATLRIADLSQTGTLGGAALAIVGYELLAYAWHRSLHRSDVLFRLVHQMHHSVERLEVANAYWFAPLDIVGWVLAGAIPLALLGITPAATTVYVLVTAFLGIFTHANVRTPRWLGLFVMRPEMHAWHHARGRGDCNYSDLPVIDWVFGTLRHPHEAPDALGLADGAEDRILDLLVGRDVSGAQRESAR
jgi:sterol desaturase/sphingolipid hydroxylase (fatty acid hydroxylase superfamily)